MKKVLSVLLALAVLLCASLALAEGADYLGAGYLTGVEYDGSVLNPSVLGLEMGLDLKADGSATISSAGVDDNIGSWELKDGVVVVTDSHGEAVPFTPENGSLTCEMSGLKLIFSQEPAEVVETIAISEPLATENVADFDGLWVDAFFMDADTGMQIPMSMIGTEISLEIAGGVVTLTMDGTPTVVPCTLVDGSLIFATDSFTMTVTLHENDVISFTTSSDPLYLVKAVDETAN